MSAIFLLQTTRGAVNPETRLRVVLYLVSEQPLATHFKVHELGDVPNSDEHEVCSIKSSVLKHQSQKVALVERNDGNLSMTTDTHQ